jgi:hypothetical protein
MPFGHASLAYNYLSLCENLAPFSKSEAKTLRLVSSDFDFSLEIKLVVCLLRPQPSHIRGYAYPSH